MPGVTPTLPRVNPVPTRQERRAGNPHVGYYTYGDILVLEEAAGHGREVAQRRVEAHWQTGHPADQPGTFRPRTPGALPRRQRRVRLYRPARAARSDGPGGVPQG